MVWEKGGTEFFKCMRYVVLILLLGHVCFQANAQHIGVKNNLLWDAGVVPNAGVEFALSSRWTLDVWGSVNAWNYPGNAQMNLYLLQPEVRFWPCQKFEGHFFGVHAHAAHFNVGMIPFIPDLERQVYRGNLYGGGISYGYHLAFGKRWGVEFTIGAGYAYIDYEKFYCTYCAESRGKKVKHYLGPTRAGISLIYFIK